MASAPLATTLSLRAHRAPRPGPCDPASFATSTSTISPASRLLALTLTFSLAACQAKVISPETVDMAGSVAPAYVDQALENLARFHTQPDSIPSQIDLADGTLVMAPEATQPAPPIPTNQSTTNPSSPADTSLPAHTLIISARLAQRGDWTISPVTDPTRLHNLAALYRYAATGKDEKCDVDRLIQEYHLPIVIGGDKIGVDPNDLTGATCVFCMTADEAAEYIRTKRIDTIQPAQVLRADHLNPALRCNAANELWLHFSAEPVPVGKRNLGFHQGQYIWIDASEPGNRLSDFVMFTLPAVKPTPNPGTYTSVPPDIAAKAK